MNASTNIVLLLVGLCSLAVQAKLVVEQVAQEAPRGREDGHGRRPVFFSELKLRSVVESTNLELRQLKRDFMRQISDVYLALKLHPDVGFEQARDRQTHAASANILLAQELAQMVIEKHIAQRRLLTGLKLAFIKLLPMQTLVNLYRRYKSFEWLKDQQQVDVRPKFPGAKENQFVILYNLIELRARVRASDDVLALVEDNMRRVLQTVQWYLVESRHGPEVTGQELDALASNAKQVLDFYLDEVVEWRQKVHGRYAAFLKNAGRLADMLGGGGHAQLIEFIDRLINVEALDIDLNEEAKSLEYPPTITAEMIANVQKRWVPWYVLKSLEEDRKLLVGNRERVLHLVAQDRSTREADLQEWAQNLASYLCRNSVRYHPRY